MRWENKERRCVIHVYSIYQIQLCKKERKQEEMFELTTVLCFLLVVYSPTQNRSFFEAVLILVVLGFVVIFWTLKHLGYLLHDHVFVKFKLQSFWDEKKESGEQGWRHTLCFQHMWSFSPVSTCSLKSSRLYNLVCLLSVSYCI